MGNLTSRNHNFIARCNEEAAALERRPLGSVRYKGLTVCSETCMLMRFQFDAFGLLLDVHLTENFPDDPPAMRFNKEFAVIPPLEMVNKFSGVFSKKWISETWARDQSIRSLVFHILRLLIDNNNVAIFEMEVASAEFTVATDQCSTCRCANWLNAQTWYDFPEGERLAWSIFLQQFKTDLYNFDTTTEGRLSSIDQALQSCGHSIESATRKAGLITQWFIDQRRELAELDAEHTALLTTYECGICMENLKSHVVRPCGHTFCGTCAERIFQRGNCPMCRCPIHECSEFL